MYSLILINLLRISLLKIHPLVLEGDLSIRAEQRAKIADIDWSHNNWKNSFIDTNCSYMGENLYKGFTNDYEAFRALLESPTHKANLVKEQYTRIGLGTYNGVTVQLFCGRVK